MSKGDKYIVIAVPPKLRDRVDEIRQDMQQTITGKAWTVWPGLTVLPDDSVAVLKGSDPHARVAMVAYMIDANEEPPRSDDWAMGKVNRWTGPTHEPD